MNLEVKEKDVQIEEVMLELFSNHRLFAQEFFPLLVRQEDAPFHALIDEKLWAPSRKLAIKAFRGSAKSSRVKLYLAKKIAYSLTRTVLITSQSLALAEDIVTWLKTEIERNQKFTSFYGLSQGAVWTQDEIEIKHLTGKHTISVSGSGIRGQIRGLNKHDYRPDTIIGDDVDDEATTNTLEQIQKNRKLFFGTLLRSLAPEADSPYAKLILIQTPLDTNDLVETASSSPDWDKLSVSCFVENEDGTKSSSWPSRLPLKDLLSEKKEYIRQGLLGVWLKEMEVTVTSSESAALNVANLKYYKTAEDVTFKNLILALDPASSTSLRADFQALTLSGLTENNEVYLLSQNLTKGEDVESTVNAIFSAVKDTEALYKTRPKVVVEKIGYQKVIAKALLTAMTREGFYFEVIEVGDKRPKEHRVTQVLRPIINAGQYFVREGNIEMVDQITRFPSVPHDDLIDSASRGAEELLLQASGSIIRLGRNSPSSFGSGVKPRLIEKNYSMFN